MKEDEDTLLVGCEEAYAFIEKMIAAASAPFRSKRIHIGMDEAWKLGQGRYLLLNGHRRKLDIMTEHHEEAFYLEWFRRHREFGSDPVFTGGIWTWNGFGADYDKTFITSNAALAACKESGISEVFVTIWGDSGTESSIYQNLLGLQLFAEHGYSRKLNVEKLKSRFKFCTGGNYDDFYAMTWVDKLPGMETRQEYFTPNASKYMMWQDPMLGLFDRNIGGIPWKAHYASLRQ